MSIQRGFECLIERSVRQAAQCVEVLAPEDAQEGAHREEESTRAFDPSPSRRVEAAGGDDAMQVDVQIESLGPRVKDRGDPWAGAEVAWIVCKREQRR